MLHLWFRVNWVLVGFHPPKKKKRNQIDARNQIDQTIPTRVKIFNVFKWFRKPSNITLICNGTRLVSFYIPWKHQKTKGFPMLLTGIEINQWHEMGCKGSVWAVWCEIKKYFFFASKTRWYLWKCHLLFCWQNFWIKNPKI